MTAYTVFSTAYTVKTPAYEIIEYFLVLYNPNSEI
jgi:hypothetical protein